MNRTLLIARIIIATLCWSPQLFAQAQLPEKNFGIGITVGSMNNRNDILGGHAAFALSQTVHLGAQVGFAIGSSDNAGGSGNYWLFAPYAKVLFPLRNEFTPILMGQIILDNGGTNYEYVPGQEYGSSSSVRSSLFLGGGAEYFPSSTLGIYGYVGILDIGLDPSETRFGLLQPRAGVEWFFR